MVGIIHDNVKAISKQHDYLILRKFSQKTNDPANEVCVSYCFVVWCFYSET